MTLAGRQVEMNSCFNFSQIRNLYLDGESLKDFMQFSDQLTNIKSLNLQGITEKSDMFEIMIFLPDERILDKLEIRSIFLKQVPSVTELLVQSKFTSRAKTTKINLLRVHNDVIYSQSKISVKRKDDSVDDQESFLLDLEL